MPPEEEPITTKRKETVVRWCGAGACERSELWRAAAAELVGTTLLVLLSCLPGCQGAPAAHRALAAGLVVTLLVQSFDHISGAFFNPAVTLAAVVGGRISGAQGAVLSIAQIVGGMAGGAALRLAVSSEAPATCLTLPAQNLANYQALGIEAAMAGCLALVNFGSWDARNRGLLDSWPLRIGATVAGLSLAAGELTGASMNPVRSFGPALWSGDWSSHWVYWAGPLGGSLCFSALYRVLWRAPAHAVPRAVLAAAENSTVPSMP